MQYDAVIFDNDGVLVRLTTLDVLRRASRAAFEDVGISDPATEHVERMMLGVTPADVREVCETYEPAPAEFWAARDGAASDAQIREMRDGRMARYDDVSALERIDAPRGVVSTNQQATVDAVLDHHSLSHLFETAYGRDPTVESLRLKKPEPHYLERAMADLDAETALFVGDSETDVLAAHRAGVDSAFIRRGHRADAVLDERPTYEIETLYDLHDVDGVPLAAADGGAR
ncbi:HAD family hydrolase [Halogeometricum luteum]|uniref:HAD family hydrolase n=1 Tax=Halogeometricum luteum TaxID=2950537 RepID=A0ABU2G042_9EURY|nr:HAD family hydrolase [Halogeometricum sp. S3BR5-2]MDS0294150.1 HAD family hydrolase [Halogeometricum sp. S3BR5-2]